jgi:hypothetical protein
MEPTDIFAVRNQLLSILPPAGDSILLQRLQTRWRGINWWVIHKRTGASPKMGDLSTQQIKSLFANIEPLGAFYAQLLNLVM